MAQHLPAVVVLLTVLLQFTTLYIVGKARETFGVKSPATTGHEGFERAYRVQMNTLEATAIFLPTLWLAAQYGSPLWAGVAGLVWVIGRAWYIVAYLKDPSKRGPAFGIATLGWAVLLLQGVFHLGKALLAG